MSVKGLHAILCYTLHDTVTSGEICVIQYVPSIIRTVVKYVRSDNADNVFEKWDEMYKIVCKQFHSTNPQMYKCKVWLHHFVWILDWGSFPHAPTAC